MLFKERDKIYKGLIFCILKIIKIINQFIFLPIFINQKWMGAAPNLTIIINKIKINRFLLIIVRFNITWFIKIDVNKKTEELDLWIIKYFSTNSKFFWFKYKINKNPNKLISSPSHTVNQFFENIVV